MNSIIIDNNNYYLFDEIRKNNYFEKFKGTSRKIVKDLQLDNSNYIYAYNNKNGEWIKSCETYSRSKILINKNYIDKHFKLI
jgi:hypothetical protein